VTERPAPFKLEVWPLPGATQLALNAPGTLRRPLAGERARAPVLPPLRSPSDAALAGFPHAHTALEPRAPPAGQRFFEKYEFKAPHLLCCSDCEPLRMAELLAHADADGRAR
jgi:hypothetical protein